MNCSLTRSKASGLPMLARGLASTCRSSMSHAGVQGSELAAGDIEESTPFQGQPLQRVQSEKRELCQVTASVPTLLLCFVTSSATALLYLQLRLGDFAGEI